MFRYFWHMLVVVSCSYGYLKATAEEPSVDEATVVDSTWDQITKRF